MIYLIKSHQTLSVWLEQNLGKAGVSDLKVQFYHGRHLLLNRHVGNLSRAPVLPVTSIKSQSRSWSLLVKVKGLFSKPLVPYGGSVQPRRKIKRAESMLAAYSLSAIPQRPGTKRAQYTEIGLQGYNSQ